VYGQQHDHDEELRQVNALHRSPAGPRAGTTAYWIETGTLVREYMAVRAGEAYNETLRQGFILWLQRWPAERQQYLQGDDRQRAALVDWYLKVVR
jgi:hypothetical protein